MFLYLDNLFNKLNANTYFIGLMMLLLNIGSKYIIQDMGKSVDYFFNLIVIRRLVIFTIFFVATRDVKASIILTACFVVIALELFNEKSKNCILPPSIINLIDTNKDGIISPDEIERAKYLLKKVGHFNNNKKPKILNI